VEDFWFWVTFARPPTVPLLPLLLLPVLLFIYS
jgi:hypothetical protein